MLWPRPDSVYDCVGSADMGKFLSVSRKACPAPNDPLADFRFLWRVSRWRSPKDVFSCALPLALFLVILDGRRARPANP